MAALERRLTAALGVEATRTLAAAEDAFRATFGLRTLKAAQHPISVYELRLRLRLRHLPTIRKLLWALARLDRYAELGAGRPGAGLEVLADRIAAAGEDEAAGRAGLPRHLGYFVPVLCETARRWKHQQAPKIKRRREAAGVRKRRPAAAPPKIAFRTSAAGAAAGPRRGGSAGGRRQGYFDPAFRSRPPDGERRE